MLLSQLFILGIIGLINAQNEDEPYEEHGYNNYESEGYERPDFSKYYSVDNSSPQIAQNRVTENNGFVNPAEFSTFFAPNSPKPFEPEQLKDASNTNGLVTDKDLKRFSDYNAGDFGVQDYFEKAQKQREANRNEGGESPEFRYTSNTPNTKSNYQDVKNSKAPVTYDKQEGSSAEDESEGSYSSEDKNKHASNYDIQNDNNSFKPSPQIPYYPTKYTKTDTTPYQKYSFQPTSGKSQTPIISSHSSYPKVASAEDSTHEYQPSETVQSRIKDKRCVKIVKMVPDGKLNKKPMSCQVCSDPKTGGKTERCSYNNEPSPKSYYHSTSYGSPDNNYRHKREESGTYSNPYEEIKANSHSYHYKPSEFGNNYYKAPDFSDFTDGYKYDPKTNNNDQAVEKSDSEIQSEELVKDSKNCQKKIKNGITCTLCKNPKTGANYEQCSYESEPTEKKYAYLKEKKYDSNDDADNGKEEEEGAGSENAEIEKIVVPKQLARRSRLNTNESPPSKRATNYQRGQNFNLAHNDGHLNKEANKRSLKFENVDDYHRKLFPQLVDEESRREEKSSPPERTRFKDISGKQDVERVLEEFVKKDRTNCKELNKKGMTCYLCIDENGVQNEECMYVSESRPVSSHVAYHNVQRTQSPIKNQESSTESVGIKVNEKQIKKRVTTEDNVEDSIPKETKKFGDKLLKQKAAA